MKNITKYIAMGVLTVAAAGIMLFSTADVFGARVRVRSNGNATVTRVNRPGFRNDVVVKVNNNGFNRNAVVVNGGVVAASVHPNGVKVLVNGGHGIHGVNGFNVVRFNTFGTRTVVDGFGNVFEVDAFGNARNVGSRGGFNQVGGFQKVRVNGVNVQVNGGFHH